MVAIREEKQRCLFVSLAEIRRSEDDDVRAPIPQQQAILVEDQYHALPYPSRQRRQQNTRSSVFDSCRDFQKETEEYEERLKSRNSKLPGKKKRLHELFRPPIDILHEGDFQSARESSKIKNRWLLVNIQNSFEFPCQVLNRDVWSNKIVREIIDANFILWQEYHDSDAGQHYGTFYPVKNHPHLSIIDPRTGERMVVWENLGMKPSANQFAELATLFLSEHPSLNHSFEEECNNQKIAEKRTSVIDLNEDVQLEAAIKASLQAETKTNNLNGSILVSDTDDDEELLDDEIDKDIISESNEPLTKRRRTNSLECLSKSEEEKPCKTKEISLATSTTKSIPDDGEKAKILLRLPDNGRKQILINLNSTLKDLSNEVSLLGWPTDTYELIKAFPRQNISELDQQLSLKEAGLHKQETLFIQDR